MVFLILEAHGALHFSRGVNKRAQWISGERMVIAAGIHIFELVGFVVATLGVRPLKEETFNLIGRVERVALFLVHFCGKNFQISADIGAVGLTAFINHIAKDQDFAGAKHRSEERRVG